MTHAWNIPASRNEQKVNGLFDDDTARNMDVGSVFQKRGIQGIERVAMNVEVAREMPLKLSGILSDLCGEIAYRYSARKRVSRRQIAGKASIDEHQSASTRSKSERRNLLAGHPITECQTKRRLPDGCGVRETPVFIVSGRESHLTEPGKGLLAQRLQPMLIVPCRPLLEFAEAFEITL